ncbi:MAG: phosphatase [Haliscomenobacter sp.]|nr:phosphatase [Haliscomenobacter sp.]
MIKTNQPLAVIDLGTNTFHLLIAHADSQGGFAEIFRERRFVKLAQESIHFIHPTAYQRGVTTMLDYKEILDRHQVAHVSAFGTAALRTAGNGTDFVREIKEKTGISIQLIDGNQEAGYILRGVRLAIPFDEMPKLIMDIGGGSVEFLIANENQVFWMHSFPIGVAVLYRTFHRHEPIGEDEAFELRQFLATQLAPLAEALKTFPCSQLVGASGTFDVLENLLECASTAPTYSINKINRFPQILEQFVQAGLEERLHLKGVPPYRADMIVVAMILIDFVLKASGFEEIWVSQYDLKEGMLSELLEGL